MRALIIAALIASITPAAALAQAKSYTTAETTLGTLMADPAAKAVLAKHLPDLVNGDQAAQAAELTLKAIQQYAPEVFTDKLLADIDADLAKLPKK